MIQKISPLPSPKRAYATEGLLPAGGLRAGRLLLSSSSLGCESKRRTDFAQEGSFLPFPNLLPGLDCRQKVLNFCFDQWVEICERFIGFIG
jgi:hypothetical protein